MIKDKKSVKKVFFAAVILLEKFVEM